MLRHQFIRYLIGVIKLSTVLNSFPILGSFLNLFVNKSSVYYEKFGKELYYYYIYILLAEREPNNVIFSVGERDKNEVILFSRSRFHLISRSCIQNMMISSQCSLYLFKQCPDCTLIVNSQSGSANGYDLFMC